MGGFSLPTSGPATQDPNTLRNPILEEIDRAAKDAHAQLSPQAQEALRRAGAPVPTVPAPPPTIRSSVGVPAPIGVPAPEQPTAPVRIGSTPQTQTPLEIAQQHERDVTNQGTGISRIHNPVLKTLATIGDVAAGTFAPRAEQLIPGTAGHHAMEIGQAQNQVAQEQGALNQPIERRLKTAQAAEQESLPAFHEATTEVHRLQQEENQIKDQNARDIANAKNDTERAKIEGQQQAAAATRKATLAQHGYKENEKGEVVPLEYTEMSEPQQAIHDLKAAQAEQAEATAALKKAQAANQPQMVALQQARLERSNKVSEIAMERLGLSEKTYNARYLGTDQGGNALPGTILTDEGKPVGTANAPNVRPTAQERNKADLASSAHDQLADLKSIVQKRPDIFGPAAGRKTDFTVWLGSQDPDAQRFRAARTIAGDHLAGVFGGRSEAALNALDAAIGHFKDNPEAIVSGLDQLDKANKTFLEKGTPRTTGSNAAKAEPVVQSKASEPAVEEWVRDPKTSKLVKK